MNVSSAIKSDLLLVEFTLTHIIIIIFAYIVLPLTSGLPVKCLINYVKGDEDEELNGERTRAGRVIGKCENILVLTFVLTGSYTALAVVFAAEGIVTRETDDDFYPIYILTGTIINFTYSVFFSLVILFIMSIF